MKTININLIKTLIKVYDPSKTFNKDIEMDEYDALQMLIRSNIPLEHKLLLIKRD